MKTKAYTLIALLLIAGARLASAADALSDTLQKGLFEEEANHNLDAAIKAYQDVIARHDDQRKLAATAIFRLGECYRKLGRTNDAVAQYQRLLGDFSEQNVLVNLSRQNLVGLGVVAQAAPGLAESGANGSFTERLKAVTDATATNQEAEEVRRIKALIKDSPDLINAQQGGLTPLHEAARKGQLVVAGFLLANQADIEANANAAGFVGKTPLILAAENGHKSIVELLLAKGAAVNGAAYGGTALHAAARKGYRSVAETLIASNASVSASDASGLTPLHEAVRQAFPSMAELLIAKGADMNAHSEPHRSEKSGNYSPPYLHGTPLHYAVNAGNKAMVDLLLKSKADPNLNNKEHHTPLHYAAAYGSAAGLAALIQGGANLDAPVTDGKNSGWTPLHYAVANGKKETVEVLLKNKANPDLAIKFYPGVNDNGFTALAMAVISGNKGIAELLLDHGANPNLLSDTGVSPLMRATWQPNAEMVELLLKFKADSDVRGGKKGSAPLLSAVERKDTAIVDLLLRHKADSNVRDENDATPLHHVVWGSMPRGVVLPGLQPASAPGAQRSAPAVADHIVIALAQLLLTNKADVNLRNAQGLTPLNLMGIPAKPQNQTQKELAELLRQHGASDEVADLQPNPLVIRAWRRGLGDGPVIFTKDTKGLNRFTMMEALVSFYQNSSDVTWRPSGGSRSFDFPNLNDLTIKRLTNGKTYREITVNLLNATNGVDCAQDVVLEFGDVIEIPEREHFLGEEQQGLLTNHRNQMVACQKRKVTLIVKGQPNELALPVGVWRYLSYALQTKEALKVLASSSDRSRVTVKRADPKGGSPAQEFTRDVTAFRASGQPLSEDLLLEDGDVIEVPDK